MSLNPKITKESTTYYLNWTPDASCDGYAFTTPTGSSRTFSPTQSRAKLGRNLIEPVKATIAPLYISKGPVEEATYPPSAATGPSGPTGATGSTGPTEPPPTGTHRVQMGVHFHGQWEGDLDDAKRLRILDLIKAAGIPWIRQDIEWRYIEQNGKGQYNLHEQGKVDTVVNGAHARGLKVCGVVSRTPSWAGSGGEGEQPPSNPKDYADFCVYAQKRWNLDALEVWNEQNPTQSFWQGTIQQYVGILKAAYPAVKAVTSTPVVLGGIAQNDDAYLSSLYANGAKGFFDVAAFHPYQEPTNVSPTVADSPPARWNYRHYTAMLAVMQANGDGSKPVWFTEFGYSTHANTGSENNSNKGCTEQQQSQYLIEALDLAETWPNVEKLFVYKIDDEAATRGRGPQLSNYGIVHLDLSPKQAYNALKARAGV